MKERADEATSTTRSRWSRLKRPAGAVADVWRPLSWLGALLAVAAFVASYQPSLMPRPWLFQGVVAGLSALSVYGVVVAAVAVLDPLRRFLGVSIVLQPERRWLVRSLLTVGLLTLMVLGVVGGHQGRVSTARLVGMPAPTWSSDARSAIAGLAVFAAIIALVRVVRLLVRGSSWVLRSRLPGWLAQAVAVSLVLGLVGWAANTYLVSRTLETAYASAEALDRAAAGGNREAPTSLLRSGGPGAAQEWSELGRQGRVFTADGPSADEITEVTGRPAIDPIRVYVTAGGDQTMEKAADVMVSELERTGAFDRSVLAVIGSTGRGWVSKYNVESLEYLTDGDVATATMQYSNLPSPMAVVLESHKPAAAGRAMMAAVRARLAQLPEDERPVLVVGGESLGAYSMQAAFADPAQMLQQVDGAVWVGTPSITGLWQDLTRSRLRGSPEVAPVIDNGLHVRFVTSPPDLARDLYGRDLGTWGAPRVVYLQHASDPITWWHPSVIYREPDWVGERAGRDVDPGLTWVPVVTFWQLTLDQVVSNNAAAGHGHAYERDLVDSWAAVLTGARVPGAVTASPTELLAIADAIEAR